MNSYRWTFLVKSSGRLSTVSHDKTSVFSIRWKASLIYPTSIKRVIWLNRLSRLSVWRSAIVPATNRVAALDTHKGHDFWRQYVSFKLAGNVGHERTNKSVTILGNLPYIFKESLNIQFQIFRTLFPVFVFISFKCGVIIHTLPHSKYFRLVSVRSSPPI